MTDSQFDQHSPSPLAFVLDGGPGSWARAQATGNRQAVADAVDWTIELGRIAEAAGIESLWFLEDPDGWDALAVLGAIARQTERIRIGTCVVNPYYRHPSLIAASMATLDLLSDGRAFLGLGRGQAEWYDVALGMDVGNPVHRLEETFDLLRQWWSPEMRATSPDEATEFRVNGWERTFRPVKHHLPIYLAAVGPKAQRIAARRADGVIFNDLSSLQFMREAVATIRAEMVRADRDPDDFVFAARSSVTVTDDPERLYEQRKSTVAIIHALPGMERLLESPGHDVARIIADVRKAMNTNEILAAGGGFGDLRRGGDLEAARRAIPTSLMQELVVAGPVADVRERLRQLHEIGITHVLLASPPRGTTADELGELVASLQVPA